jgi:hypothetical protein
MIVTAAFVLISLEVHAQTPRDQAARLGAQAQEACLAGRHEEAVRLYEEAFRLRPHPRREYYLGIELQHLDRPVEASEAFERYLESSGTEPEYVADAVSRRNEVRSKVGEIELRPAPAGAALFLDGQSRRPGADGRLRARAGVRRLVLRKEGFVPFEADAQVWAGERTIVPTALRPQAAPRPVAEIETVPAMTQPPTRPTEISLLAGAGVWSKLGEQSGTPAFVLGASHRLAGEPLELRAAARALLGTIADREGRVMALGLVAGPALRYAFAPEGVAVSVETGLGVSVLSGVTAKSRLLQKGAAEVTGALAALAVRPALTLEVPVGPGLALLFTGSALWTPAPSHFFVERSLTRFELGGGLSLGF